MKKKALLVGINAYRDAPLRGCVNDVQNMSNLLQFYGFEKANIKTLLDRNATKTNILAGLEALVADVSEGDYLVFHYSGHGSQVPDLDGDEPDRLDEILCPVNLSWERRTFITDDELAAIFNKLPTGVRLEVFLDCCHSGSGTRNVLVPAQESLHTGRFVLPPSELLRTVETVEPKVKTATAAVSNSSQLSRVAWSGCRDDQTSADALIGGTFNGAFTYTLCNILRSSGIDARGNLLRKLRAALRANGYEQVPQLDGSTAAYTEAFLSLPSTGRNLFSQAQSLAVMAQDRLAKYF
jgi:hypothetical protein